MRFRRIRRAFPWRTAALLAVLSGVPVLVVAVWFVWEMEPLQSYYLLDYRQCGKAAEQAGSATEIRWLMKAAPGRASLPAIPSDVIAGRTGNLSLRLSSAARNSGWISLEKSVPEEVSSAELKGALSSYVYHGRSYSDFIALPLLEGCTLALVIAAFIVLTTRAELWREWTRFWRQLMAANSATDDRLDSPPIRSRISQRIALGKWLGKARSKLDDWAARSHRTPTIDKAAIPVRSQGGSPPNPLRVQLADTRTKLSLKPPSQAVPRNSVQEQSIFPGARRGNGAQQEPVAWDESQWID